MRLKRYGCARRPSQAVGALFLTCGVLLAAESITVDRVQQRYPWNGLVDIDYTIAGVEGDPNELNAVTVTCVPLTEGNASVTVVDLANGEDLSDWSRLRKGRYLAVSEIYTRTKPAAQWTLSATNAVRQIDILAMPGFKLIFR